MSIESRSKQYGGLFGDWHIEKRVGSGSKGRSEVFSMYRDNDGWREYRALKVISLIEEQGQQETMPQFRQNEYAIAARSQRNEADQEVRLMNQIRGKTNIVDYLDHKFFEWRDESGFGTDLLIQMELLTDLRSRMKNGRIFTEQEVVKIGQDICQALVICHGKDILHRDIKPENIFFNADGDYKLGDFGISRILSNTSSALASTGIGTAAYSAPEQFRGGYDHRVDIYSLGLVLYELSNQNRLPFATSSYVTQGQIENRLSGQPLPEPCGGSAGLRKIIRKACAFDVRERYATAEEMLHALLVLDAKVAVVGDVDVANDPYATEYAKGGLGCANVQDIYGTQRAKDDAAEHATNAAVLDPYGTRQAKADTAMRMKNIIAPNVEGKTPYTEEKTQNWKKLLIPGAVAAVLAVVCLMLLLPKEEEHIHTWLEATCISARTCEECDETEGVALGHTWSDPSCVSPSICAICGQEGGSATGHQWIDATYGEPAKCSVCHETEGVTLTEQMISEAKNYAGSGQYRYAIQMLDNAWKESGDQIFFDLAAEYRLDFGLYASAVLAAGKYNSAIRYADGDVYVVGDNEFGEREANNWSNITAISMGDVHTVGLRSDGRVVVVSTYDPMLLGHYKYTSWKNVVAISAGDMHTVALLANGTVVSDGYQCQRACDTNALMAKAGNHRIVAIAAGFHQTLALLANGTVVADGADKSMHALDVEDWTDIAAIVAGSEFSAGLRTDGTVVVTETAWDVSDWKDIVALAAGDYFLLGLRSDGTVLSVGTAFNRDIAEWTDIVCIAAGHDHAVAIDAKGYVHNAGSNIEGQHFPDGTIINDLP